MCGIAGYVGDFIEGLMARMNRAQAHRGPDASGVFEDRDQCSSLGHVRLSILDLSEAASQPMYSADSPLVLSYNGEIYNYRELRADLENRGIAFSSSGDTEVLFQGLRVDGQEFIRRLNGMFAFALWNRTERTLLLARDPLGIKPLYYTYPKPGTFLFASEMKALCAHPDVRREPEFEVLQQHLGFGHASSNRTALRGIRRLEPGNILCWSKERPTPEPKPFWQPDYSAGQFTSYTDETSRLRDLITVSSERQLVSDVPLGTFLSGGLDSSCITSAAAKKTGTGLQCYTISYPESESQLDGHPNDAPFARQMAQNLGLQLDEIEIKPNVAELLPRLIYHLDEPLVDPAAIACYLICQRARSKGTKVLLSGQGADELFCGYPRYTAMKTAARFDALPGAVRGLMASLGSLLPGSWEGRWGAQLRRVRRGLREVDKTPDQRFLNYCSSTPQDEIAGILSGEVRETLGGKTFADDCGTYIHRRNLAGINRFRDRDLFNYLPNHNLLYTDKMGMAVGLEARVPLLDLEIVSAATHYPPEWLLRGSTTKAILREAVRDLVPAGILDRPKAGFGAPIRKWLRYDLADQWQEITSETTVRRRGWFDSAGLVKARAASLSGKSDLFLLQWGVITLELWARQFLDRNPADT